mmetsp:Transcript_5100/g.21679  ORF Transcript_5100/g.21679 Transcript_5100/m.21679 type:complete len:321 (-) Transcript_5100:1228-2190(-)
MRFRRCRTPGKQRFREIRRKISRLAPFQSRSGNGCKARTERPRGRGARLWFPCPRSALKTRVGRGPSTTRPRSATATAPARKRIRRNPPPPRRFRFPSLRSSRRSRSRLRRHRPTQLGHRNRRAERRRRAECRRRSSRRCSRKCRTPRLNLRRASPRRARGGFLALSRAGRTPRAPPLSATRCVPAPPRARPSRPPSRGTRARGRRCCSPGWPCPPSRTCRRRPATLSATSTRRRAPAPPRAIAAGAARSPRRATATAWARFRAGGRREAPPSRTARAARALRRLSKNTRTAPIVDTRAPNSWRRRATRRRRRPRWFPPL